jgi:hypothetical protein
MKTISSPFGILNLTSILLASMALGAPMAALGQWIMHENGVVSFQNDEATKQGVASHLVTNFDNTLLVGTPYKAELYILDTSTGTLKPLPASVSSFRSTTTTPSGTWAVPHAVPPNPPGLNPIYLYPYGGVDVWVDVMGNIVGEAGDGSGTGPGYYPVTLRVRAWDSTTGSNWETATIRGESPLFTYTQRFHSPSLASDNQMVAQPGFQLTVLDPPRIQAQPQDQIGYWGKAVSFSIGATGALPLNYQWFKDGLAISWATDSTLNLTNLDLSAGGDYFVVVANSFGSITSNPALLVLDAAGLSLGLYPGVTIDGVVGKTYGIQYTTDLSHTNSWLTLTNFTLTQPVQLWLDTSVDAMAGTVPRRFYRLVAAP